MVGVARINEALIAYGYVATWIGLSSGVILFNKYILSFFGFPFPISLTMIHMLFCSTLAFLIIRVFKLVQSNDLDRQTYIQKIVPVGALFALSLWLSNTAYVYLSAAFIQMLKALMPAAVYTVGMFDGDRTAHVREVGEYVSNYVRCVCIASLRINLDFVGGVDLIGVRLSSRLMDYANNINPEKAQNEFDNDVVLRVAGVWFSIGSIYNLEVPRYLDSDTEVNTSQPRHFALERCTGARVEHGGIFVNREDIGVNDERRRSGRRLVADFH